MRVVCLTHVEYEGPAGIADWAELRGHDIQTIRLWESRFPHPDSADFVVIMGGPMNIYEESRYPWLAQEKAFLRSVVDDGRTLVLGVCLGAQLVADALGGRVASAPQPEIGWYPVELTAEGRRLGVFDPLPDTFDALHWHGDRFEIPHGAINAASTRCCDNQAFVYDGGRVVALQFHLEADRASWSALCEAGAVELTRGGECVSSAEEMLAASAPFEEVRERLFGVLDAMAARRFG